MDKETVFIQFLVALGVLALAKGQIIAQEAYGSRRIISSGYPGIGPGPIVDSYQQGSVLDTGFVRDPYNDPYADPYIRDDVLPIGGGAYPFGDGAYPVGGGAYPVGGGVYPVGGGVYPAGGVLGGIIGAGRRPAIVEDRSSTRFESINVSNNNNNHRVNTGSSNVVVNQVSTNTRSCSCQVGIPGQCYPQVCVPDSTCSGGGGNGVCGSGHGGMMLI